MFCPTCGLKNQPDRNFCRGCGTNLRVLENARQWGSTRDPRAGDASTMRAQVADVILKKVGELNVKNSADLKRVIKQVETLLESDEVKKARHLRDAAIRMLAMYGVIGIAAGIAASGASDEWAPVVAIFLIIMGLPVMFVLRWLGRLQRGGGWRELKLPEDSGHQIGSPPPGHQTPSSVTEHTTQQLGNAAHQPPKGKVTHRHR